MDKTAEEIIRREEGVGGGGGLPHKSDGCDRHNF